MTATGDDARGRTTETPTPWLGRDESGPVFREAWEAQAFALALALHERSVFTWSEWTGSLAKEIRRAQSAGDPDTGETYYHHWLAALEQMVDREGLDHILNARALPRRMGRGGKTHPAREADRTCATRLSTMTRASKSTVSASAPLTETPGTPRAPRGTLARR